MPLRASRRIGMVLLGDQRVVSFADPVALQVPGRFRIQPGPVGSGPRRGPRCRRPVPLDGPAQMRPQPEVPAGRASWDSPEAWGSGVLATRLELMVSPIHDRCHHPDLAGTRKTVYNEWAVRRGRLPLDPEAGHRHPHRSLRRFWRSPRSTFPGTRVGALVIPRRHRTSQFDPCDCPRVLHGADRPPQVEVEGPTPRQLKTRRAGSGDDAASVVRGSRPDTGPKPSTVGPFLLTWGLPS